ncbi:peroxisome biogenesis protein 16-like [Telopea speciosissima]|uniref:peroxisome biogenesis protein 16-like n=1 Tax=Telopea speciosissima TaxID=54955 RepID=UPI001CC5C765|nr:peroxisome biogenesis protein 16-like [Telopea speciosissima]
METYKRWVRKNKDYVHQMESLASGLTWFLPERFSNSEIGPEAVTTILGILTAINEHIIDTAPTQIHAGPAERASFPWPLWISMLKDLESLVEVVAQQYYGDDKKWHFIAITEATKVLVRLSAFRDSGYKMLLQGGETPNAESDPNTLGSCNRMGNLTNGANHGPGYFQKLQGHNTRNLEGRALTALNRFGQNARMESNSTWLKRHQQEHAVTSMTVDPPTPPIERPTLSTILSEKGLHGGLFVMAEVLCIARPLVYVLFIRKYGVRSWMPWLVSLAVDLTGVGFLSYVTRSQNNGNGKDFPLSTSEQNEIKRRKLLWALYIMRDPFFSKYTRQRLENTEKFLEPVPVIGVFTAKLIELIVGAQSRYTYMSGS